MCKGPEAVKHMVSSRRPVLLECQGLGESGQKKLERKLLKGTMLKSVPSTLLGVIIVENSPLGKQG